MSIGERWGEGGPGCLTVLPLPLAIAAAILLAGKLSGTRWHPST